jgi:hypothetical protein
MCWLVKRDSAGFRPLFASLLYLINLLHCRIYFSFFDFYFIAMPPRRKHKSTADVSADSATTKKSRRVAVEADDMVSALMPHVWDDL